MELRQQQQLKDIISTEVKFDCSLKDYTSFAIGGPAAALVRVEQTEELQPLLQFVRRENIDWRVIGRGTNILVRDEGFPGVVITLAREFTKVQFAGGRDDGRIEVRAGAGLSLAKLSSACMASGFAGLEFVSAIPGNLGGAVVMNAGAWGGEIADVVAEVSIETADTSVVLTKDQLKFCYRACKGFEEYLGTGVITGAMLLLRPEDPVEITGRSRDLLKKRRQSQPSGYPNAGSFFRNPEGDSAGRLIDINGLKGTQVGGAMISRRHGNFIVNRDKATAKDVRQLMRLVQDTVKANNGVILEPEVHFI
jgi:UDP-N-acetylmuramate dehydrogenase